MSDQPVEDGRRTVRAATRRARRPARALAALGRLIVISGPSGAGKGTLIARLMARCERYRVAVSATTRPRRPAEVDGREYIFLDDADFQRRVDRGDFLEHVSFAGGRYGTLQSEVDRLLDEGHDVILELEIDGAFAIRRRRPGAVLVFIDAPSFEDLESRLRARATESAGDIETRLQIAREQVAQRENFDVVIVNDDVSRATEELLATLRGAADDSDGSDAHGRHSQ